MKCKLCGHYMEYHTQKGSGRCVHGDCTCSSFKYPDEEIKDDPINPEHYRQGAVECIDAIRAALTTEEFRGFLKGQIIKYVWRMNYKGGSTDLEKAMWYANKLLEVMYDQSQDA